MVSSRGQALGTIRLRQREVQVDTTEFLQKISMDHLLACGGREVNRTLVGTDLFSITGLKPPALAGQL
jgi:hypothetical protein